MVAVGREPSRLVMVWLQHGLLPVLWNQVGRDSAVDVDAMFDGSAPSILATKTTPGIFMNWMQIVGGVRLRQRRLQEGTCDLDPRLQERFSPSCYTEFLQVSPFGPGIGSKAEGFVPEDVLGAFDVRYSLGTPFREILENFEYMLKEHNWVGEASQSLQIQAAMVHGEATPPFFVMFEVRFDFKRSGFVRASIGSVIPVAVPPIPGAKAVTFVLLDFQLPSLQPSAALVTESGLCVTTAGHKESSGKPATRSTWSRQASTMGKHHRRRHRSRSPRLTAAPSNPAPSSASRPSRSDLGSPRRNSYASSRMRSPEVGRVQEGRGIRIGRLQSLLVDKPQAFLEWLQGLGVQTCSDLRGMWPGGGAMVEEFEAQVGRLPADEALTLALVWTLSINQATSVQQAVVRDLVDQRESAVRGRPMVEVPALSQGRVAPAARQVLSTGLARDVIQTVAPALADPHGREQVRKQAKIQELFEFVVEHLVDLRELGLTEADTVDPARMQLFKDNLMQSAQRLGVERLGALLSAGRRWRRHAQGYQISVSAPSPLQVSQFLQQ
eukprot:symbB.v1.2.037894.t1/scaffold5524.1/size28298/3